MTDDLDQAAQTVADHVVAAAIITRPSRPSAFAPPVPEGCCANCGTRLQGPACHQCGQVADTFHRPILSLFVEVLDGLFSFDGRYARTLPDLMLRPGRVTRRYLEGARARFVPPFRLYIVASLVFFLIAGLQSCDLNLDGVQAGASLSSAREQLDTALADGQMSEAEYADAIAGLDRLAEVLPGATNQAGNADAPNGESGGVQSDEADSVAAFMEGVMAGLESGDDHGNSSGDASGNAPAEVDAEPPVPEARPDGGITLNSPLPPDANRFLEERVERILSDPGALAQATVTWVSRIMFLLVPVYAGLLSLVYVWRRGFFYFDHLVVSLHLHAALFLFMSAMLLAAPLIGMGWGVLGLLIYSNVYLYRLHRSVYQRSVVTSILRTLVLDFVYFIVLTIAFTTVLLLGVLSL